MCVKAFQEDNGCSGISYAMVKKKQKNNCISEVSLEKQKVLPKIVRAH